VTARLGSAYTRLDNYPAADGHVQIVPVRHVESFFELTAAEIADMHMLLRQAAQSVVADGFTIGVNEGRAAGRTVDHLHVHLIPRRWGDVTDPRGGVRNVLPGGDPDRWATVSMGATEVEGRSVLNVTPLTAEDFAVDETQP
jgi:diadenosine tetraphosphate (Ap4A) HIT family hydrolase